MSSLIPLSSALLVFDDHPPGLSRTSGGSSETASFAAVTVAELRYGALAAGWGTPRRARLEADIATRTVVPVTDAVITGVAALRSDCRDAGHPLHDKVHANDLWIAASAIRIGAPIITADRIFDGVPGLEVITV